MSPRRPRPGAPDAARDAELSAELDAIYAEVEALYAGRGCPQSTECCRFGVTGREPYVTTIEWMRVRRAIARREGRLPTERPTPLTQGGLPLVRDERACPLLGKDGRCTIYDDRPFGCRTFWCERASGGAPVRHRETSALVAKLKALAARHQPGGDEGRPLTRLLAEGKRS